MLFSSESVHEFKARLLFGYNIMVASFSYFSLLESIIIQCLSFATVNCLGGRSAKILRASHDFSSGSVADIRKETWLHAASSAISVFRQHRASICQLFLTYPGIHVVM